MTEKKVKILPVTVLNEYRHKWIYVEPGCRACKKCNTLGLQFRKLIAKQYALDLIDLSDLAISVSVNSILGRIALHILSSKLPCEISDKDYKLKSLL